MKIVQIITSVAVPLLRDNVDTDQIIPAEFLKIIHKTGLGQHLFAHWRQDAQFVLNRPQYREAQILLAGKNFGCGSSREHAPWALWDYGFRVVIAQSFADIFKTNALKNGLLPIILAAEQIEQLADKTVIVNLVEQTVACLGQQQSFQIDPFTKARLVNGLDDIDYTLQLNTQTNCIAVYEQTHPRSAR